MQIGDITVNGQQVGVISLCYGDDADFDPFIPDLDGYVPEGRASEAPLGMSGGDIPSPLVGGHGNSHISSEHSGASLGDRVRHGRSHVGASMDDRVRHGAHHLPGRVKPTQMGPEGPAHQKSTTEPGNPVNKGSEGVNQAIEEAAKAHHFDPAYMKAIASIESGMDPSSNANNEHKYKGLYQIGPEEWKRFGQGNIYNARDNAMAAARMWDAQRDQFRKKFGRNPTDAEQYMIHQQGMGFHTNGTMTNIAGNLPPSDRTPENMTHAGFEQYWGNQIARREAQFSKTTTPTVSDNASPAPSSILARAKQVAQSGGPGAVQRFMAANGYPKDGNWCGEFAAAVVKSTGGSPPKGAAVASNWRTWGRPTVTPKPGDVAIRRGPPTGDTGSHVTFVDSYDPATGKFKGIGGNQGAWEENLPAGRYEFRTDQGQTSGP